MPLWFSFRSSVVLFVFEKVKSANLTNSINLYFMEGQKIWNNILGSLKGQVTPSVFKTWFAGSYALDFKKDGNRNLLIVAVKNSFLKEQIEHRYLSTLTEVAREKNGNIEFAFVVSAAPKEKVSKEGPIFSGNALSYVSRNQNAESVNPNHTFSNFVVGFSNNIAYLAATQVSANLGSLYNPLFIFGSTGVGKTHLMQAVANEVLTKTVNAKVLYVSAEKFTNDFIESLNNKSQQAFRAKYRNIDILLVDDIQFLAGKESTQDEFFFTFNELYLSGKQLVCASDRHPKELSRLKQRLVSRFLGGMTVDLGLPDYEMRVAIVNQKCKERGVKLPPEIVTFLAKNSSGGARELEGAMITAIACLKLSGGQASLDAVRASLSKRLSNSAPTVSPGKVINAVCRYFKVTSGDLTSPSRKASFVYPRQILMFLLRSELALPLEQIGHLLGGRDHSTVIHGISKIETLTQDPSKNDELLRIKSQISTS